MIAAQLCRGGPGHREGHRYSAQEGQAAAAKKATREATEGLVGSYIHAGGKIGVLVEVNCESDFVARTEAFQHLCHDIAMHIAALDRSTSAEEVDAEMLEAEREIYRAQALATGKPEPVVEKIVTVRWRNSTRKLPLRQHYIKDEEPRSGDGGQRRGEAWRKHQHQAVRAVQGRRGNGNERAGDGAGSCASQSLIGVFKNVQKRPVLAGRFLLAAVGEPSLDWNSRR